MSYHTYSTMLIKASNDGNEEIAPYNESTEVTANNGIDYYIDVDHHTE